MNLRKITFSFATAIATLALVAAPVLAAIGNQNPQLTVQLTVSPTVVTAPAEVTGNGTITNNTKKTNRVTANVKIVSPSGVTTTYSQKYSVGPYGTVSQTVTYSVGVDAEKGLYTITLSATDRAGTSSATEYLTVQ